MLKYTALLFFVVLFGLQSQPVASQSSEVEMFQRHEQVEKRLGRSLEVSPEELDEAANNPDDPNVNIPEDVREALYEQMADEQEEGDQASE